MMVQTLSSAYSMHFLRMHILQSHPLHEEREDCSANSNDKINGTGEHCLFTFSYQKEKDSSVMYYPDFSIWH